MMSVALPASADGHERNGMERKLHERQGYGMVFVCIQYRTCPAILRLLTPTLPRWRNGVYGNNGTVLYAL